MGKHKLDKEVEDILQHYGIQGMKWGVRRTEEQIASSENGAPGGGGGDGEEDESFLEEMSDKLKDTFEAIEKKLGNISDTMKKKGKNILISIFGKSETKYSKAKPDDKTTKQFREAMSKYDKASPAERTLLKKGYTVKTESSLSKSNSSGGSSKNFTTSSGNKYSARTVSDKEYNSLVKNLEKQGYKKEKKPKKERL